MRKQKVGRESLFIVFFVGLFILAITSAFWKDYATVDYLTATVKKTDRISQGTGESLHHKYVVWTDSEVLENTDTIMFWKYNSSDIQGELEPGKTYKFKVNGVRFPFLSWYRNILSIEEINQ